MSLDYQIIYHGDLMHMAFYGKYFRQKGQAALSPKYAANRLGPLIFFGILLLSSSALAHPGALNQFGCHYQEMAGDYECHRGKLAGKFYARQIDMARDHETGKNILDSFVAKVVAVTDGDTLKVMRSGEVVKVSLAGIDCPEEKQPFWDEAKRFTLDVTVGRKVILRNKGIGHEGLPTFEVILPDGRSLNKALVKAGLAWWFIGSSKDKRLADMEKQARIQKVGLWKNSTPLPPWEFRKGKLIKP